MQAYGSCQPVVVDAFSAKLSECIGVVSNWMRTVSGWWCGDVVIIIISSQLILTKRVIDSQFQPCTLDGWTDCMGSVRRQRGRYSPQSPKAIVIASIDRQRDWGGGCEHTLTQHFMLFSILIISFPITFANKSFVWLALPLLWDSCRRWSADWTVGLVASTAIIANVRRDNRSDLTAKEDDRVLAERITFPSTSSIMSPVNINDITCIDEINYSTLNCCLF